MPPVGESTENTDEGSRSNPPPDRPHRLAGLPAIPDFSPLGRRVVNPFPLLHRPRSISEEKLACCVHRPSPPPKADLSCFTLSGFAVCRRGCACPLNVSVQQVAREVNRV